MYERARAHTHAGTRVSPDEANDARTILSFHGADLWFLRSDSVRLPSPPGGHRDRGSCGFEANGNVAAVAAVFALYARESRPGYTIKANKMCSRTNGHENVKKGRTCSSNGIVAIAGSSCRYLFVIVIIKLRATIGISAASEPGTRPEGSIGTLPHSPISGSGKFSFQSTYFSSSGLPQACGVVLGKGEWGGEEAMVRAQIAAHFGRTDTSGDSFRRFFGVCVALNTLWGGSTWVKCIFVSSFHLNFESVQWTCDFF